MIYPKRRFNSITFGWCTRRQAMRHVGDIFEGKHVDMGPVLPNLNHGRSCQHCR